MPSVYTLSVHATVMFAHTLELHIRDRGPEFSHGHACCTYLLRARAVNHRLIGKGQQRLHSFQFLLVKGLHFVLHKEFFGSFTQQTREIGKVQGTWITAGGKF